VCIVVFMPLSKVEFNLPKRALPQKGLLPLNPTLAWSFYNSRPDSYIETRGPTGGPEVVEILYSI
jgi:hypothetical protein